MNPTLKLLSIVFGVALSTVATAASEAFEADRSEITQAIAAMKAAANAHDSDRHVAFYAKDTSLVFVINSDKIVGWQPLLEQQRKWWNYGKTDVTYTQVGETDFSMPAPGLVMTTYFLKSASSGPDGSAVEMRFGISALWQKRSEGWRIIYAHESVVAK